MVIVRELIESCNEIAVAGPPNDTSSIVSFKTNHERKAGGPYGRSGRPTCKYLNVPGTLLLTIISVIL